MPIACDASSLMAQTACLDCGIPPGMRPAVIISLLCQIAGTNCDPATLMANAACIDCQIPQGMRPAVIISLLCQIANGNG
jgi:hypothetical protein